MDHSVLVSLILITVIGTGCSKSVRIKNDEAIEDATDAGLETLTTDLPLTEELEEDAKLSPKRSVLILMPTGEDSQEQGSEENAEELRKWQKTKRCKTPARIERVSIPITNSKTRQNPQRSKSTNKNPKLRLVSLKNSNTAKNIKNRPTNNEEIANRAEKLALVKAIREKLKSKDFDREPTRKSLLQGTNVIDDDKYVCYCKEKATLPPRKETVKPQWLTRKNNYQKKKDDRILLGENRREKPIHENGPRPTFLPAHLPPLYPDIPPYSSLPSREMAPIFQHPYEGIERLPYVPYAYHVNPASPYTILGEKPTRISIPFNAVDDSVVGQPIMQSKNQQMVGQAYPVPGVDSLRSPQKISAISKTQEVENGLKKNGVDDYLVERKESSKESNKAQGNSDYNLQAVHKEYPESTTEGSVLQVASESTSFDKADEVRESFDEGKEVSVEDKKGLESTDNYLGDSRVEGEFETTGGGTLDYSQIKEVTDSYFTSKAYSHETGEGDFSSPGDYLSSIGPMEINRNNGQGNLGSSAKDPVENLKNIATQIAPGNFQSGVQNSDIVGAPKNSQLEIQNSDNIDTPENFQSEFQNSYNVGTPQNFQLEIQNSDNVGTPQNPQSEIQNLDNTGTPENFQSEIQNSDNVGTPQNPQSEIQNSDNIDTPENFQVEIQNSDNVGTPQNLQSEIQNLDNIGTPENFQPKIQNSDNVGTPQNPQSEIQNLDNTGTPENFQSEIQNSDNVGTPQNPQSEIQNSDNIDTPENFQVEIQNSDNVGTPQNPQSEIQNSDNIGTPENFQSEIQNLDNVGTPQNPQSEIQNSDNIGTPENFQPEIQNSNNLGTPQNPQSEIKNLDNIDTSENFQSEIQNSYNVGTPQNFQLEIQNSDNIGTPENFQSEIQNSDNVGTPQNPQSEIQNLDNTGTPENFQSEIQNSDNVGTPQNPQSEIQNSDNIDTPENFQVEIQNSDNVGTPQNLQSEIQNLDNIGTPENFQPEIQNSDNVGTPQNPQSEIKNLDNIDTSENFQSEIQNSYNVGTPQNFQLEIQNSDNIDTPENFQPEIQNSDNVGTPQNPQSGIQNLDNIDTPKNPQPEIQDSDNTDSEALDKSLNEGNTVVGKSNSDWRQAANTNTGSNEDSDYNAQNQEETEHEPSIGEPSSILEPTMSTLDSLTPLNEATSTSIDSKNAPSNQESSASDYWADSPGRENNAGPLTDNYEGENFETRKEIENTHEKNEDYLPGASATIQPDDNYGTVGMDAPNQAKEDQENEPSLVESTLKSSNIDEIRNSLPFCDNTLLQKSIKAVINKFAAGDSSEMNEETVGSTGNDLAQEIVEIPNLRGIVSMPAIERTILDKVKDVLTKLTGTARHSLDNDRATNVIRDNLRHMMAAAPVAKTELPPNTVEERQFKDGKWVSHLVTLEPTLSEDTIPSDFDKVQASVKNLLLDPAMDPRAAKQPAVQNMIVESVRNSFRKDNQTDDNFDESVIQSTLDRELSLMEMEEAESTTNNAKEGELDVSNIDMEKLLDIAKEEAGIKDESSGSVTTNVPKKSLSDTGNEESEHGSVGEKKERIGSPHREDASRREEVNSEEPLAKTSGKLQENVDSSTTDPLSYDVGAAREPLPYTELSSREATTYATESRVAVQLPNKIDEKVGGQELESRTEEVSETIENKSFPETLSAIPEYQQESLDAVKQDNSLISPASGFEVESTELVGITRDFSSSTESVLGAASPDDDLTYLGKISVKNNPVNDARSLEDSDLYYVGDGVKLPLEIRKLSDGSYALSISRKVCEHLLNKECPCCVPTKGNVVRTMKRNSEKTRRKRISKRDTVVFSKKRGDPADDGSQISSMPVESFAKRYNLSLNLEKLQTPWNFEVKNLKNKVGNADAGLAQDLLSVHEIFDTDKSKTSATVDRDENGRYRRPKKTSRKFENYRYQRNIDEDVHKRMEIVKDVLNWLRKMILNASSQR